MIPSLPVSTAPTTRSESTRRTTNADRSLSGNRSDASARVNQSETSDIAAAKMSARRTSPEFSSLLALLYRTMPAGSLPAQRPNSEKGVSFLDHLLNDQGATSLDPSADLSTTLGEGDNSGRGAVNAALQQMRHSSSASEQRAAMDSLRNAMTDAARAASSTDEVALATPPRDRGPSSSTEVLMRAVARQIGKRGTSREELLAVGDTKRAAAHAALDRLLSQAGTSEGALLTSGASSITLDAMANAAANAVAVAASNASSVFNAHSAGNAKSSAAADVTTPSRDPLALNPELRSKLDHVVARMRGEYGSDVSIVETSRTQERQDYLYAQGRTRPGNVVTWTKDSAHTRGDAVDVVVDGSWTNAEGFARLQRIAREEGLRTLGLKDPGHLELPRDGRALEDGTSTTPLLNQRITTTGANATVAASRTGVASVATVANVASVASVSGRATSQLNVPAPAETADTPARAVRFLSPSGGGVGGDGGSNDAHTPADRDAQARDGQLRTEVSERGPRRIRTDGGGSITAYGASLAANPVSPVDHADRATAAQSIPTAQAADRVAGVQELQSNANSGPLSRMTLDIDGPNGPERITVDLRGHSVGAHITTDTETADRMRLHTAELEDALRGHGLNADSVRISATAKTDGMNNIRGAEREASAIQPGAVSHAGGGDQPGGQSAPRDRSMTREWERELDRQDDARKARDEQRQNAGQRGQRETFNQDAR